MLITNNKNWHSYTQGVSLLNCHIFIRSNLDMTCSTYVNTRKQYEWFFFEFYNNHKIIKPVHL